MLWTSANVPLQHQVSFIEAVKILDMKMMAQIFTKEHEDFASGQAPILKVS